MFYEEISKIFIYYIITKDNAPYLIISCTIIIILKSYLNTCTCMCNFLIFPFILFHLLCKIIFTAIKVTFEKTLV